MSEKESKVVSKKPSAVDTIRGLLERSKGELERALPKHLTVDRLIRVAMTAVQTNPVILECSPLSLVKALMQSAQLGIEPDGLLGQGYLVPFYNDKTQQKEAQFIIGYRGLIALARRSGELLSISADVVREKDHFVFQKGLSEKLEHIPVLKGERGELVAAYAVAHFRDGSRAFEVMGKEDVESIKKSSKAAKTGPWATNEAEMWKKTVAKRMCKWLPLSAEFATAIAHDNLREAGENIIDLPAEYVEEPATKEEDLKARIAEAVTAQAAKAGVVLEAEGGK